MNFVSALGPHADFIILAYLAAIVVIGALIGWIAFDYAAQQRILDAFDERGVRRAGDGRR
jgi:heme exporter protein D